MFDHGVLPSFPCPEVAHRSEHRGEREKNVVKKNPVNRRERTLVEEPCDGTAVVLRSCLMEIDAYAGFFYTPRTMGGPNPETTP